MMHEFEKTTINGREYHLIPVIPDYGKITFAVKLGWDVLFKSNVGDIIECYVPAQFYEEACESFVKYDSSKRNYYSIISYSDYVLNHTQKKMIKDRSCKMSYNTFKLDHIIYEVNLDEL